MTRKTAVILLLAALASAAPARASEWSGKLGLDAGSIGGIVVHDFATKATVSGLEWDATHILYNGAEVAEAGAYVGKRDVDAHFLAGPSIGTPAGSLAVLAKNVQQFIDWPFLSTVADYGQYVHAYVNVGWDLTRIQQAHARPDLIGAGGVLKFGASTGTP